MLPSDLEAGDVADGEQLLVVQQQARGWGDDVVGRIAQDLSADTGSARGFSRRNLFYMRRLAMLWPDSDLCSHWLHKSAGLTIRC